jgi:hypothetical protein
LPESEPQLIFALEALAYAALESLSTALASVANVAFNSVVPPSITSALSGDTFMVNRPLNGSFPAARPLIGILAVARATDKATAANFLNFIVIFLLFFCGSLAYENLRRSYRLSIYPVSCICQYDNLSVFISP